MKRLVLALAGWIGLSAFAIPAGFASSITVDEFGNSLVIGLPGVSSLPFALSPDAGPGGLPSTLTYTLPFATTTGDVTFRSASDPGIFFGGDVIRFNPGRTPGAPSTLVFYSDTVPGNPSESLADTPGPPGRLYPNTATTSELGLSDENNHALYFPQPGQPGFTLAPNGIPASYDFVSDGIVPEPTSVLLMATGLGFLGIIRFLKPGPTGNPLALGRLLARRSERP